MKDTIGYAIGYPYFMREFELECREGVIVSALVVVYYYIGGLRIHIMAKVKFYAVAVGRKPGVYNTWGECQEQVSFVVKYFLLHYHTMHSNCKLRCS